MKPSRPMKISPLSTLITVCLVALAAGPFGCGGSGSSGGGSGGTSAGSGGHGSGGTASSSGGAGSGGTTGSGGTAAGSGGSASGGVTASGGATASGGKVGSGGASSGGAVGSGGTASGGAPGSGGAVTASGGATGSGGAGMGGASGHGGAGTGGSSGTGGMGTSTGWHCPAASMFSGMVPFSGSTTAATRVMGAPPLDTFNNMGYNFTNVEGPVWIGDALYYSEMTTVNLPPARILKLTEDGTSSVFIDMSGSNGLATDGTNIFSANHGAQGIVKFSVQDKTPTTVVSMFDGMPFDSPNDLAIASDGTIYFSDPNWQNNTGTQAATRVYQVAPGSGTAVAVTDYTNQPNGVTLSLDEASLFVDGGGGLKKYAISNGKVDMTGTAFGPTELAGPTDGMVLDCAGNLYVTVPNTLNVIVLKPDGTMLGTVTLATGMAATNVAFGGADHQTLYITAQGANMTQGVYKIHLNIPGKPY